MTSQPPRSSLLTSVLQDKEKGLLIPQTDINKTNQIKANLKQLSLLGLQGINMALVFMCPFPQDEVTDCLPLNAMKSSPCFSGIYKCVILTTMEADTDV